MTKLGPEKKSGQLRNPDNQGPDNQGSTVQGKLSTNQEFFFYSPLAFLHAAVKDVLVEKSSFTLVAV